MDFICIPFVYYDFRTTAVDQAYFERSAMRTMLSA